MSNNNNNDNTKDKNKNSKNKTRSIFIVKQRTRLSKYWTPVSRYNQTGNFMGAAVFESRKDAENYLEIYKQKIIARIQQFVNKKQENPAARVPVFATRDGIRLEVFEESQLPPVEKPAFINFKKW
jgi:hypothetical protein